MDFDETVENIPPPVYKSILGSMFQIKMTLTADDNDTSSVVDSRISVLEDQEI